MYKRNSRRWKGILYAMILVLILPSVSVALAMGEVPTVEEGAPPLAITLHPDDAKIRNFERWRPSWVNRQNLYNWYRARADFNGNRALFWASGLSVVERRGRIVDDAVQGRVLRVKYPSGKFRSKDSGVSFPWILRGKYEELNLTYRVRFQEGFQFVTSGKLPGLCGGLDEIAVFDRVLSAEEIKKLAVR